MARLPRLIGRGRALEVLLGADDIGGDLAELYGYVNRSLPDAELDAFVDALATRISSFDKQAIAETKRLAVWVTSEFSSRTSLVIRSRLQIQSGYGLRPTKSIELSTTPECLEPLPGLQSSCGCGLSALETRGSFLLRCHKQ